MEFLSAYSPKRRVSVDFDPKLDRAKQSFKAECDINTIMSRYMATGILPETLQRLNGQYLDVTGWEFQSAMDLVAGAASMFEEMPSALRSRFNNDPASFLDFCSNPANRSEMAELGLLKPGLDAAAAAAPAASASPAAAAAAPAAAT